MEEFFKDLAKGGNKLTFLKVLYALIIFLGAFLTFMFQPVVGKILTPQYGGGADIWASCLLFFQFILFGGYFLALFLNKLKSKTNAICYAVLFILALILFKLSVEFGSWLTGDRANPLVSLFISLFKYAALPVLVLSTVSVSMQNWYTRQTGESPYILYSISNIGSFLALFLYPLVYEPLITITSTVKLWHNAFILLVFLIIAVSVVYFLNNKKEDKKEEVKEKIDIKNLLYWIALSAAGTILLASYTTFVTVKILPVPMLWTLFLGLYLLTFVLCFGSEKFYKKEILIYLVPVFALINILSKNLSDGLVFHPIFSVFITGCMFFVFLMIANGEIYKTRPNPSRLSEFYLAIAFGGVLGGFFVNIIAPLIFNSYVELPLINTVMYLFALYLFVKDIILNKPINIKGWVKLSTAGVLTIAIALFSYIALFSKEKGVVSKSKRNFYGTITLNVRSLQNVKVIKSGNTIHGAQNYDVENDIYDTTPLTYYTEYSAFAYAVEGMRNFQGTKKRPLNIGVVGLGAGTAASYAGKKDKVTFYEIDPKMYETAKDEFTYLKEARGKVEIKMGDARIVLNESKPQGFDVFLIDAFSSDSVPVHLITKEAFDIYKKHTKEDGIIVFHISNSYLDIDKALKKIADVEKLKSTLLVTRFMPSRERAKDGYYKFLSKYFVVFMPKNKLYKNFKNFEYETGNRNEIILVNAEKVQDDKFLKVFTDDYSSLVRIFKFWSVPDIKE